VTPDIEALVARLRCNAEVLQSAAENIDFPGAYLNPAYDYAEEAEQAADALLSLLAQADALRAERDRLAYMVSVGDTVAVQLQARIADLTVHLEDALVAPEQAPGAQDEGGRHD